jgi:hypothetical protein
MGFEIVGVVFDAKEVLVGVVYFVDEVFDVLLGEVEGIGGLARCFVLVVAQF